MKHTFTLMAAAMMMAVSGLANSVFGAYRTSDYVGTMETDMTSMGMAKTSVDEQRISVTPTTYGYCDIVIYDFSFDGTEVGDLNFKNTELSFNDAGDVLLSGSLSDVALYGGNTMATISLSGTIDGDGNMTLNLDIVSDNFSVPVTFTGAYAEESGLAISESVIDSVAVYYRLDGSLVGANPCKPGLYIVKKGDTVTKVLCK